MRVCDYIAQRLYEYGVRRVYGITGGGAAGLNDGFAKHGGIQWIGTHHEQGAAFAAMGEAKLTGRLAVVNPTTGCGGTNCVTGVLDAWQDGVPVLFISGNVNKAQMTYYHSKAGFSKPRQHGVQEADIIPIVSSIVKYANVVDSADDIVEQLDVAIRYATTGRKGPVWLDIPTDVQTAEFDPSAKKLSGHVDFFADFLSGDEVCEINQMMGDAKRPLVLVGAGAQEADLSRLINRIPFVVTYGAIDVSPDHFHRIGIVGVKGDRAGNMALYNADLVIVLGSSLSTPVTGYNLSHFAPKATFIVVDISPSTNHKYPPGVGYCCDVQSFVDAITPHSRIEWSDTCYRWRSQWPVCLPEYSSDKDGINLYWFVNELSKVLPPFAAVVSDAGSALYVTCQALKLKEGQRHIQSLAQADMGWALPASIGVALEGVPTIVLTGDGSFQSNLQELATIKAFNLPIKIFVWNNSGYLSIRATQNKLFEGRVMGTDAKHGLWFPELLDIARTYKMDYYRLENNEGLSWIPAILESNRATIIEVICPPDQLVIPTIAAKRLEDGTIEALPLYDMSPRIPGIEKELIKDL